MNPTPACPVNPYVEIMYRDYPQWAFADNAQLMKGVWREQVFKKESQTPLDLEIGTGNGYHFAHLCKKHPERSFLGMELKYKPLIQTIRRCLREDSANGRLLKCDANDISKLFGEEEIDNVYIHHPDPWPKKRHLKNRLIQPPFLKKLYSAMKPGSQLEFKTDHLGYFQWATEFFKASDFEFLFYTEDLHNSSRKDLNFVTQFESLFIQKNQPIYYSLLAKPN